MVDSQAKSSETSPSFNKKNRFIRRASTEDSASDEIMGTRTASSSYTSSTSSTKSMFRKLRPLSRPNKIRAKTTGTLDPLANRQVGSVEFLHDKGLDSGDFVPRQAHPLLAAEEHDVPATDVVRTIGEEIGDDRQEEHQQKQGAEVFDAPEASVEPPTKNMFGKLRPLGGASGRAKTTGSMETANDRSGGVK